MALVVLTSASPGAPRNAGTNGDLTTLLDWAVVQATNPWAIEYTSGNARVYRPAVGNRFRLHVNHDSATSTDARLATVRGCENASNATTLVDPFPTVAQKTNLLSTWKVSSTADTTNRPFIILLTDTFIIYLSQYSSTSNLWEMGFWGDAPPSYSTDVWNTLLFIRNGASAAATTSSISNGSGPNLTANVNGGIFWVRDASGATKSTLGNLNAPGTGLGSASTNLAPARGGYLNTVPREKLAAACYGSNSATPNSLALMRRGWIPNMWTGLTNGVGTLTDLDTFTDTAYNPSASFMAIAGAAGTGAVYVIVETTDTWTAP